MCCSAIAVSGVSREGFQTTQSPHTAAINAFQDVFLLIGLLALAGAAVALLISDRAAASTMAPKVGEVPEAGERDVAPAAQP